MNEKQEVHPENLNGNLEEVRAESENDVNPHLLVVDTPPTNIPQDAQPNLDIGEDRDRRRNDEDRAPPDNQDERQPPSPRTTRSRVRETGISVPEFPNVQPTVLERSRRDQAAARELMNQFRQQTTETLMRNRPENRQNRQN